jgi:putative acetyltransferase
MKIRPVEIGDNAAIISLIDGVYREYGEHLCLDGAEADLVDTVRHYSRNKCVFVVLDDDGEVVGTHAVVPLDDRSDVCTFRRLYLRSDLRGTGWGEKLMRWAIDAAEQFGFHRVEFWSDVRFARAHRFFERLGFQHDGRVREMNDGWEPYREYFFSLDFADSER